MAQVILGGAAGGVRNTFRDVRTQVYAKRAVGDDWTYLPYLTCLSAEVAAGPSVGTAEFAWTFGTVTRAETRVAEVFSTYFLNRAYVKVEVSNGWGSVPIWYGVVESEQVRPWGNVGIATGKQTFVAYELSQLLDRCAVVGSYITLTGGTQYVDETLVFNGATNGRRELYKNRLNGVFGANVSAQLWSAWDVLDYVFTRFVNGQFGITFVGHGTAQEALTSTWERWDFRGMTPKQILDVLVDRKKGLGWRITPEDDLSTVYVHVFSQLAEDVAVGDGFVPANENQTDLQFAGYRDVEATYHFGELTHYDLVRVQGGPIYSTASFSYADGTLEEHWTTAAQVAYDAGSEKEGATAEENDVRRLENDLAAVYQRHKVPDEWDGLVGDGEGGAKVSALPRCGEDGVIYTDAVGYGWRGGKRFERELPWEAARGDAAWSETNAELLMALFKYEDPAPIDPENVGEIWARAEALYQQDVNGARVTPEDTDLSVSLDYVINHFFALGHFNEETAGASKYSPKIDYRSLVVTARLRTDERLKLVARVPTVEFLETGKTKDIFVPEAIAEYVCPGTITGVLDGAPARLYNGFLRDDTYRLGRVLALALAFYGLVRCTLSFEARKISVAYPVGTLVRNTVGPEGVTGVGTVVTRQRWEFTSGGQRTSWQTGYEELDFVSGAAGGEGE